MSLFRADSRDVLVTLLGFSKGDIANKVLKRSRGRKLLSYCPRLLRKSPLLVGYRSLLSSLFLLSWTEHLRLKQLNGTPDVTDVTKPADRELITTVRSLFNDSIATLHTQEADFSTIGTLCSAIPDAFRSLTRFMRKIFPFYPSEESEVDRLVTKALVLGDFCSVISSACTQNGMPMPSCWL